MMLFNLLITEDKIDREVNEPVEADKPEVRQECYSLPKQFEWDTIDVHNPSVVRICIIGIGYK